jgi:hypothetical protein
MALKWLLFIFVFLVLFIAAVDPQTKAAVGILRNLPPKPSMLGQLPVVTAFRSRRLDSAAKRPTNFTWEALRPDGVLVKRDTTMRFMKEQARAFEQKSELVSGRPLVVWWDEREWKNNNLKGSCRLQSHFQRSLGRGSKTAPQQFSFVSREQVKFYFAWNGIKRWAQAQMEDNPEQHCSWSGGACENSRARKNYLVAHASPVACTLRLPDVHFRSGGKCLPLVACKKLLVDPDFCRILCSACDPDGNKLGELINTAFAVPGMVGLYNEFKGGLSHMSNLQLEKNQQGQKNKLPENIPQ